MFSGNDFRRIASVPAEKWTGPRTLQFSSVLPQPSNRFSSKATPAEKKAMIPRLARYWK